MNQIAFEIWPWLWPWRPMKARVSRDIKPFCGYSTLIWWKKNWRPVTFYVSKFQQPVIDLPFWPLNFLHCDKHAHLLQNPSSLAPSRHWQMPSLHDDPILHRSSPSFWTSHDSPYGMLHIITESQTVPESQYNPFEAQPLPALIPENKVMFSVLFTN